MGFLRWAFVGILGLALSAGAASAGSYVPTASVSALAAYGSNSALIGHATVYDAAQNVSYDWYATCPGVPDGSQYVAATGVATGCWVRLSLPPAIIIPPGTSGQFLLNSGGAFDATTLTCSDISDAGSGCSGSLADYLALTGGTLTGKLVTAASGTGSAGLNLPPGTAPTSPVDGDVWTTTLGMYAQINGSTVGPFGAGGGGGSPGGSNTQVQWNNSGTFGGITGATTDGTTLTLASPVFSGTVSGAGTIPNSVLANSSMTIAGHSISLGGTQAIACGDLSDGAASCSTNTTNAANISSGTLPAARLSGSYTGVTGVGALTAGSIGVGFTAIGNSSLANSSMTIAGHSVSLGGTQAIACADLSTSGTLCTLNTLPLADLASQAADTMVMNASGSSAAPTAVAMPTTGTNGCAGTTNALTYNTTTHALGCNTISGGGTGCIPPGSAGAILYDDGGGNCLDTSALTTDGTNVTGSSFANSSIQVLGSSTGKTTLASANAGATNYTITIPAATDTLVGKATTDVLTNKTYDTAGTGNSFAINGVAVTTNSGTGAVVRATSPSLTTPNLGTPTAITLTNGTGLPVGGIASIAANTFAANVTGSSASPTAASLPSCGTTSSALQYTSGTGLFCGTSFVTGPGSSTSGHIATFNGSTGKVLQDGGALAAIATSGSASDLSTGTIPTARLPGVGTCTAALQFGGGTTGITYANGPLCRYVQLNGTATLTVFFTLSNKGSSTGAATIAVTSGPNSTLNVANLYQTCTINPNRVTPSLSTNEPVVEIAPNTMTLNLLQASLLGSSSSALTDATFANNTSLEINCSLITN